MSDEAVGDIWARLAKRLVLERAVCVRVDRHEGSVPREVGAWMVVFASDVMGTVGGGHLEFDAIAKAREILAGEAVPLAPHRYALGPSLGQCCGGVVWLGFELHDVVQSKTADHVAASDRNGCHPSAGWDPVAVCVRADHAWIPACAGMTATSLGQVDGQSKIIATSPVDTVTTVEKVIKNLQLGLFRLPPVALFGGGHVGKAIVALLGGLPMRLSWIDSRDEIFPSQLPHNVVCEHSAPVESSVSDLALIPSGSRVLIMSFSHAEDLEIVAQCLLRQRARADLPFIGLIGSKTKWASFRHRLASRGFTELELAHVTCPIGLAGIEGKEPEVIAVAVAAQLLSA